MNYDQLKDLSLIDLLALLGRTVSSATVIARGPDEFLSKTHETIEPPILLHIDDFEIRARFYTPSPPEVYVGDPPGTCSGLGSAPLPPIKSLRGIFKPH